MVGTLPGGSSASIVIVDVPLADCAVSIDALRGISVPVESLTTGIVNALGDAVGSVVSQGRKASTKRQKLRGERVHQEIPRAAPVVERIVRQSSMAAQKKNSRSVLIASPHDYSARMGGRVIGGVQGIFAGAGSIVVGGTDIALGVVGCVTGTVGCLTDTVFCVGDTLRGRRVIRAR